MNSRAEKPNVPTPDAASVYQHHLSQMSRPMRVAVERYVDALAAKWQRERDVLTGRNTLLQQRVTAAEAEEDVREQWDAIPHDDPTKQRMRDEQDALLAGMQAAREVDPFAVPASNAHACWAEDWRGDGCEQCVNEEADAATPSPAAGAVALADVVWPEVPAGWWWDEWIADTFALNGPGGWHGTVYGCGLWRVCPNGEHATATPPTLAAAQAALLAELRKRGTLPVPEAASTAPAVVRGDGAIDWDAVISAIKARFPGLAGTETPCFEDVSSLVQAALKSYHAQLEAAAGKKAGV